MKNQELIKISAMCLMNGLEFEISEHENKSREELIKLYEEIERYLAE